MLEKIKMSRKKNNKFNNNGENDSSGGGWEIVFSGFVLILLCFFIMLSSFASIEQGKVMRFVKSFVESISMLTGGLGLETGKVVLPSTENIVLKRDELSILYDYLTHQNTKKGLTANGKGIQVVRSRKGLTMRLSDTILFDSGSAVIRPEARPVLSRIREIIAATDKEICIEGHTDNLSIHTPQFPSNWELSTGRAINVLRYILQGENIDPKKVSAVGCSEYQPLFPNDSKEHRELNRRVDIIFTGVERNDADFIRQINEKIK